MDPPADSPREAGRPPKRIRTTKPCDYCKQKKIRCQFPQEQDGTTSKTLPCEHCVQFGLVCIVAGVERQNQQPAMVSVLTVYWNFPMLVADDLAVFIGLCSIGAIGSTICICPSSFTHS